MTYLRIIFFCTLCSLSWGQNLVLNSGFELVNSDCDPVNFLYANAGSPDLLAPCSISPYGAPANLAGYENAYAGSNYGGFIAYETFTTLMTREYIHLPLSTTLVAGQKYCVSYLISLGDTSCYQVDGIGVYFSPTAINIFGQSYIPVTPQLLNTSAHPLSNKSGWQLIEDTLIASGGENYITIGNFFPDSLTYPIILGPTTVPEPMAYYYIDNIKVMNCGPSSLEDISLSSIISVFPNPASSTLNFSVVYDLSSPLNIEINDISGRLVKTAIVSNPVQGQTLSIDVNELNAGSYFITIKNDTQKLVQKLVLTK